MNWLLDTDVICQPAKRHGDGRVLAWLAQEKERCFTSAIVIAQLAYWVRSKEGPQRQQLQAWLQRLVKALGGRILGFNVSVAHVWADQERLLEEHGQRMPVEDAYIAATRKILREAFPIVRSLKTAESMNEILVAGAAVASRSRLDAYDEAFDEWCDRMFWQRIDIRKLS